MRLIAAALAVAFACLVNPANAQVACSDYKAVKKGLKEKYGEALIAQGEIAGGGEMQVKAWFELWASKKRTWTLLFRRDGTEITCWIATGSGIDFPSPEAGGDDL